MVLSSDNDTGIVYTFQVPQSVIRQRLQITQSIETYAYPEIISICDLCVVMDRQGMYTNWPRLPPKGDQHMKPASQSSFSPPKQIRGTVSTPSQHRLVKRKGDLPRSTFRSMVDLPAGTTARGVGRSVYMLDRAPGGSRPIPNLSRGPVPSGRAWPRAAPRLPET